MSHTFEIIQDECPPNPVDEFLEVRVIDLRREGLFRAEEDEAINRLGCLAFHRCGFIDREMLGVAIFEQHAERILGRKPTPEDIPELNRYAQSAAHTYTQYINGDVYGYVIKNHYGDVVDSCWGYYGYRDAEEAAEEAVRALDAQQPSTDDYARAVQAGDYQHFLQLLSI
jgi:hypothetical protein